MLERATPIVAAEPTVRRRTLDALQGLRALAALLVVCDHAIVNMVEKAGARVSLPQAYFLGGLGVTMFFAISGFVMVYAHGADFGEPGATRRFYARRLGRIVPLYWTLTLLYALKLALEHRAPSLAAVGQSLAFLPFQMPDIEYGQPVLGQGWTLSYEMLFYLVFGLALMMRGGVVVVFAFFALTTALGRTGLFGQANPLAFWASPIVLFFLGGVAIGLVRRHLWRGPGFDQAFAIAALLLAASIAAALTWGAAAWPTAAVSALAALGAVAACAWSDESPGRSWRRGVAKHLGDATYSIYLTHTLVIGAAIKLVTRVAPSCPVWLFTTLMLPLTAIVGLLVYRFVERPLIRGWAALFGARRRPAVGDAVETRA